MGAENKTERFCLLPRVAVALRSVLADFVNFADVVPVFRELFSGFVAWPVGYHRVGDIESILQVTGGMLLGDEKGIEVPETGLYETVQGKPKLR